MKVRAIFLGFYGGRRRYPGQVFEFHGKKLGSWMEAVDSGREAPVRVADEVESPETLSGLNRQQEEAERKVLRKKGADHAG